MGLNSLHGVEARVDTRVVNSQSFSGALTTWTIVIGQDFWSRFDTSVDPGDHQITAIVTKANEFEYRYSTGNSSYVEVWDSDTGEALDRIPLGVQEVTVPAGTTFAGAVNWTIRIDVYR